MPSTLVNRNVTVSGRRTSVRLEPLMWQALEEVARERGLSIHALCSEVDARRGASSLTAAIRCALLTHYREAARTLPVPPGAANWGVRPSPPPGPARYSDRANTA